MSDGRISTESKLRIGNAKAIFQRKRNVVCNKSLSLNAGNKIQKCYVEPGLLSGCESWNADE